MISPVFLITIPLLIAFIATLFKRIQKPLLGVAILANLASLFFIEKGDYFIGGFQKPYGINLLLDDYSLLGVIIINIVFALTILMSSKQVGKYSVVLLISLAALNGMILTGDLFNLFVFMEIGAIAAYILTSMTKKFKESFNYLIIGTIGAGMYLFGVAILYSMFGSLNMSHIGELISKSNVNIGMLLLPTLLIFIGLAIEAKLLPFNGWVKGVLKNANGLVGALIASVYSGAILIVFGRIFGDVLVLSNELKYVLVALGVITFILGEIAAFSKKNIREILLFSSIAQAGLAATLFIYNLSFLGLIVVIGNVVSKFVLFSIAGNISEEAGTDSINELRGIFNKYKLLGVGFSIAALSLMGLPLFYGFFVKMNVLVSLFNQNNLWLPALILFGAVIEGAYFMRILVKLWNSGEEGTTASSKSDTERVLVSPVKMGVISILVGALLIVSGIMPNFTFDKAKAASESLNNAIPSYDFRLTGGMN